MFSWETASCMLLLVLCNSNIQINPIWRLCARMQAVNTNCQKPEATDAGTIKIALAPIVYKLKRWWATQNIRPKIAYHHISLSLFEKVKSNFNKFKTWAWRTNARAPPSWLERKTTEANIYFFFKPSSSWQLTERGKFNKSYFSRDFQKT